MNEELINKIMNYIIEYSALISCVATFIVNVIKNGSLKKAIEAYKNFGEETVTQVLEDSKTTASELKKTNEELVATRAELREYKEEVVKLREEISKIKE